MFEPTFLPNRDTKKQHIKPVDFSKLLFEFLKDKAENPQDIINTVSKDCNDLLKKINKEIDKSANEKSIENDIFSENPKITPEIRKRIQTNNRDFLENLLINCDNEKNFNFWLNNGVYLTKDVVVSAVLLRSKAPVLKVLYEHRCFEGMRDGEKIELRRKAKRLAEGTQAEKESFTYLNEILANDLSKTVMSLK